MESRFIDNEDGTITDRQLNLMWKKTVSFQDLLKEKGVHIDVYMCGHDHCKNIIETKIGDKKIVNLVIGTGAKPYKKDYFFLKNMKIDQELDNKNYSDLIFHSPNLGVCLLKATKNQLTMTCYNEELQEEFEYQIKST